MRTDAPASRPGVLVIGATGGIGQAIVAELADRGHRLVLADLPGAPLDSVAARCGGPADRPLTVEVALTDPVEMARAVEVAESHLAGLDVVVQAAGIAGRGRIEEVTDARWSAVLEGNLSAVFYACRAAVPALRRRGGGTIIALASAAGLDGPTGSVAYSASKAGVIGLCRTLAAELAREDIRVWAINPTAVRTSMVTELFEDLPDAEAALARYAATLPMGRLIEPAEIAALVRHLIEDRPPYTPLPLVG